MNCVVCAGACPGAAAELVLKLLIRLPARFFDGFLLSTRQTRPAMSQSELTTRYFTSYSGARLPLNLVGELAVEDMRNRNTFYRGLYDAAGLLTRCEKLVYGQIEVSHDYRYHPDGRLAQALIQNGDDDPESIDYPA